MKVNVLPGLFVSVPLLVFLGAFAAHCGWAAAGAVLR